MDRIKCEIREASGDDRGMLLLLAEETLHPLAEGAGHPERYHAGDLSGCSSAPTSSWRSAAASPAGSSPSETDEDACAVRCICVNPGFEARGVANQLLDWVEGLAIERRLSRLVAYVPATDAPSLRLYRGHGFSGHDGGRRDARAREAPAGGGLRPPVRAALIAVPYDLGRADVGSGRGPGAYLKAGAAEALRARGHEVEVVTVRREAPFAAELDAVLEVDRAVAAAVTEALRDDALPLVVAGNCNVDARGPRRAAARRRRRRRARLARRARGLQHPGHHRDRLPRRHAAGHALRPRVPRGGRAAAGDGAAATRRRWCTPAAATSTARSGSRCSPRPCASWTGGELRERGPAEALAPALDALAEERREAMGLEPEDKPPAHLHVDIDVLDPAAAPGVAFPTPRGLSAAQLLEVIDLVRERFALAALTLTSFTPDRDEAGTTLAAGLAVLQRVTTELAHRR